MSYAFDVIAGDGDDYRKLPLTMRKLNLERILARRVDGIFIATFERGAIGPDLFRVYNMVLEGLVSKQGERGYSAGPCNHWIKVKNPLTRR